MIVIAAGVKKLEATSFVSPKWVPQMGDNSALLDALAPTRQTEVCYSVLVPNMRGLIMLFCTVLMMVILVEPVKPLAKKISIAVSMKALSAFRARCRCGKSADGDGIVLLIISAYEGEVLTAKPSHLCD